METKRSLAEYERENEELQKQVGTLLDALMRVVDNADRPGDMFSIAAAAVDDYFEEQAKWLK